MRSLSLRLTHKITAIGVIGLIGVVLVGGIHLYGENTVAVYRSAAESARSVAELNRQIEVELLEGRRAEKDFLLRNDAKKADSQIEISKAVAADIDTLHDKVVADRQARPRPPDRGDAGIAEKIPGAFRRRRRAEARARPRRKVRPRRTAAQFGPRYRIAGRRSCTSSRC